MRGGRIVEASLHRATGLVTERVRSECDLDVLPIRVAGTPVDLAFATPRLAEILGPALEHARREDAATDAWQVLVWDASTGHELPGPATWVDWRANGEGAGMGRSEHLRSSFHYGDHSVALLDLGRRVGSWWVRDAEEIPGWSRAAPCRALLSWILAAEGRVLVHAAAVADPATGRGALLVGAGGAGKSTTTALATRGGLVTCGDDYVALSQQGERLTAHAVYGRAKLLGHEDASRPAGWAPVGTGADDKTVYDVTGAGFVPALDVHVVAVPRPVGTGRSTWRPLARSEALAAVAVPTTEQISWWRHEDRLWSMLSRVRPVALSLGDRAGIADDLRALLADPAAGEPDRLPPVTVLIPHHDTPDLLRDAVASVRAQDAGEVEVVVVDDASAEDPSVLCCELGVRLVRLPDNRGPAAARNAGVAVATHDVIGFLDADDVWPSYSLAPRLRRLVGDPGLGVVQGRPRLTDLQGRLVWSEGKEDFPHYIGTMLVRRSAFEQVGVFAESLRFGEDVDWFLRLAGSGVRHEVLGLVTLDVRRHDRNVTEGRDLKQLGLLRVAQLAIARKRAT